MYSLSAEYAKVQPRRWSLLIAKGRTEKRSVLVLAGVVYILSRELKNDNAFVSAVEMVEDAKASI